MERRESIKAMMLGSLELTINAKLSGYPPKAIARKNMEIPIR